MSDDKPRVYLTSNVFSEKEIGSNQKISKAIQEQIHSLWRELESISELKVFEGRFPTEKQLKDVIISFDPEILGCHLSHPITDELLRDSNIMSISTSTAGYNHIQRSVKDDILITNTPGVLHDTVADYTVALMMANLRNLIDLHDHVWSGNWAPKNKWDLDQNLSSIINSKTLGIIGLGEIGKELIKRLYPWNLRILYNDIHQSEEFEKLYPHIEYREKLEDIFKEADIVSIHVPLNKHTEKLVNKDLLKLMKKGALLVNTARGPILDMEALLDLLEKKEIMIDIAFDVFPIEPIDSSTLNRLKKIKEEQPEIRMVLIPHNASADADTRGRMDVIFLEDIIRIIKSSCFEDLKDVHIIPEQRANLSTRSWKIEKFWSEK